MTDTLAPIRITFSPAQPNRPRAMPAFGHLFVAALYVLALVAAPAIVRYAPAPSAPIATAAVAVPVAPHVDCSVQATATGCTPGGNR